MMKRLIISTFFLSLIIPIAGCSITLPVQGTLQQTTETFNGAATGYLDGGGTLVIVTSKGANCQGSFAYVSKRDGKGIFKCDDGRSGPFEFVSTGSRGAGTGDLSGEKFTFTFGKY